LNRFPARPKPNRSKSGFRTTYPTCAPSGVHWGQVKLEYFKDYPKFVTCGRVAEKDPSGASPLSALVWGNTPLCLFCSPTQHLLFFSVTAGKKRRRRRVYRRAVMGGCKIGAQQR